MCSFINTIFSIDNFWSIAQTILGGIAIYLAYTAWNTSQEQLKEMKIQFKYNNVLQYHLFRYNDMSDAGNLYSKITPELLDKAIDEGVITKEKAKQFVLENKQFEKWRWESMGYIAKMYEQEKKDLGI